MSESSADPDATGAEETEQTEEVFANRAERRAKGKKSGPAEVFSKGQQPVSRGAVQSPRQYGNRRSG
ncbi:hypothetical protein ACWKSP_01085 [Micromonosporaceae bacterium Da 78-11]